MTAGARTKPVFKWPGGKFRLAGAIATELSAGERLVEPFVGSGAVFLNTDYPAYLLCDANADLVSFYRELAGDADALVDACRALFADGNDKDVYLRRRERFNALPEGGEKAALFLYLNRFGYNGLVRYNSGGGFNVPFGKYKRPYFPEAEMRAFAEKTARCDVEFRAADFRATMASLEKGDVAYCDPPYFPLSATANFTAYSGAVFGVGEQRELARLVAEAAKKGIPCVVSNHDIEAVRELYSAAKKLVPLRVRRSISCNGTDRQEVDELLIVF